MRIDKHFTNNLHMVESDFKAACNKALEKCGLEAETYAKMLCPVETGALRNSITHRVVESQQAVVVGTDMEYAPYVELGTGIYATMGGGRTTPWVFEDSHGEWHMTNGQRAQPYLKPSVADHATEYRQIIEDTLKSG